MAIIEEKVFLSKKKRFMACSLSNDLDEIKNALYEKTGVSINNIAEAEWKLNARLAQEVKNLMQKHNVVYSAAPLVRNDNLSLIINRRVDDDYYFYHGQVVDGVLLANNEKKVFLPELNSYVVYSLSNDLEEIKNALYEKTGVRINDITEPEWSLNANLAEETKNLMRKNNVVYSATSWTRRNKLSLIINRRVDDDYYLYSGNMIDGKLFSDVDPVKKELTREIWDSLEIKDIMYAEYAEPGAIGFSGGVMLYVIEEHQFDCYMTKKDINEELYYNAKEALREKAEWFLNKNVIRDNALFTFYDVGFGNNVFINKNFPLIPIDIFFVYINEGKIYFIHTSSGGVFNTVKYGIKMEEKARRNRG